MRKQQTIDIENSWRYQTLLNKRSSTFGFENPSWMFQCDNRNRGIIRMNLNEAALLWQSVKETAGPILEIGRRHGGSTVLLSSACEDRPVFSIDISPDHSPLCEEWFKSSPVAHNLNLLTGNSNAPPLSQKLN